MVFRFSKKWIRHTICSIVAALLFINSPINLIAAEESTKEETTIKEPEELYAQSAVLMDADSGRILFEKNGQEALAMASTTKIMTCILALENGDLDSVITASQNAASQPAVRLGVSEGQQFILRDLLYSLMLESHNDSAVVIAEAIGTSVEGFADLMNEKAEQIGCTNTYFITPNGLDAEDEKGSHHTTAEELAKIMKYCIMDSPKKDLFLKITQTAEYSFSDANGNGTYDCRNHNALLQMMTGALSGKTGFTNEAGYCYVGALENEGRTFIVSLLACGWPNHKGYKWSDSRKLLKYGIENFHYRNIYEPIELSEIVIMNGIPDDDLLNGISTVSLQLNLPKTITEDGEFGILLRDDAKVEVDVTIEEMLSAPVITGERAGSVNYLLNGEKIAEFEIVTSESKVERTYKWCADQIFGRYFMQY